jgi:hypothetical protein
MAADKRADVIAVLPGIKLVIEIKRHYHPQVWISIEEQLERFYTRDPGAQGFGIYVVFWFGERPGHSIPKPPAPFCKPRSANEMQSQLQALVRPEMQTKVTVVVLDVTGDIPAAQHAASVEELPLVQVVAEKYRDGLGNSWGGRGRRPKWLVKELELGKLLEDFAIK